MARLANLGGGTICLVAVTPADPDWPPKLAGAETAELGLAVRDGYRRQGWGTCCWRHW